jgi:hypothetical protein
MDHATSPDGEDEQAAALEEFRREKQNHKFQLFK